MLDIRSCFEKATVKTYPTFRVIIDVFRASTTTLALLQSGVEELLISNEIKLIKHYVTKGYTVVSEVFDLGIDNSPTLIINDHFSDKKVILKTSNLTEAIACNYFHGTILLATFNNINSVASFIKKENPGWVEIIPSGYMDKKLPNIEDTDCANYLKSILYNCDNTFSSDKLDDLISQKKNKTNNGIYIDDLYYSIKRDISELIPKVSLIKSNVFMVNCVN